MKLFCTRRGKSREAVRRAASCCRLETLSRLADLGRAGVILSLRSRAFQARSPRAMNCAQPLQTRLVGRCDARGRRGFSSMPKRAVGHREDPRSSIRRAWRIVRSTISAIETLMRASRFLSPGETPRRSANAAPLTSVDFVSIWCRRRSVARLRRGLSARQFGNARRSGAASAARSRRPLTPGRAGCSRVVR